MVMAKARKPRIKPLGWSELGMSAAEGKKLEAAGLLPLQVACRVTVPIQGLPERSLPRTEQGDLVQSPFLGRALCQCFEGEPEESAEALMEGRLPAPLVVPPEKALEALGQLFMIGSGKFFMAESIGPWWYGGAPDDMRCPELERAKLALGFPSGRPTWSGTIAGAFGRGLLTIEEVVVLAEGHTQEAVKVLDSRSEAALELEVAKQAAARILAAAEHKAKEMMAQATKKLEDTRNQAALDITVEVFGASDAWRETLESEVLRAARIRLRVQAGTDLYQVLVDWDEDSIEVVRNRDAMLWKFSWTDLNNEEIDVEFAKPLLEALQKFDPYGFDTVCEYEKPQGLMLLQFRARNALEKLKSSEVFGVEQLPLQL